MSEPYVGEVRIFAGNFAPAGWAICDGSVLPISENEVLYTLIGTTYGGDGQQTFALPDLRGRIPVHQAATIPLGSGGGVEAVTLTIPQLPSHVHVAQATAAGATAPAPAAGVFAAWPDAPYATATPNASLAADAVQPTGGSQPHDNMPPYLGVNFIISLTGVYPTQN